jgi:heme-degrading monooxygenase HmoA
MAWGFISELPISREQYDRLNGEIGQDPEGLILHTSSEKGGSMRVIDVWESKEAFERFEQETLMPAAGRAGIEMPDGPPQRDEFEVHNMRGPGAR